MPTDARAERPLTRRLGGFAAGALAFAMLWACAPAMPQDGHAAACEVAVADRSADLRVMLVFRQPVDGSSAPVLDRLRQVGGHCVVFLASVSPTVHSYSFRAVSEPDRLRAALLGWPMVQDVVPDLKALPSGIR